MPRQPEGRLVAKIRSYLERRNVFVFKVHGGDNPFQEVGIPDLLCCHRGMFLALEVKQPGEEPSKKQDHVLRRIEAAGGITAVVDSVEDVIRALTKVDRER